MQGDPGCLLLPAHRSRLSEKASAGTSGVPRGLLNRGHQAEACRRPAWVSTPDGRPGGERGALRLLRPRRTKRAPTRARPEAFELFSALFAFKSRDAFRLKLGEASDLHFAILRKALTIFPPLGKARVGRRGKVTRVSSVRWAGESRTRRPVTVARGRPRSVACGCRPGLCPRSS